MTADLVALALRIETETEGSRELDDEIALARGWKRLNQDGSLYDPAGKAINRPNFTRSVDAALLLVPEGWGYEVGRSAAYGWFRAKLWPPSADTEFCVLAKTGPLSVCAASLRARAATPTDDVTST